MARQHPRRKGNPDLRRKTNQPGVEIPEITKELFELLEPTMLELVSSDQSWKKLWCKALRK